MDVIQRILSYKNGVIVSMVGTIMLFSCKTDLNEINKISSRENMPDMVGYNVELWYNDSTRLKNYVSTPEYIKHSGEMKFEEFPKGIHTELYGENGELVGSLTSKYAKKMDDSNLWEVRDQVVVLNAEGKKLETELLYWDMEKELIYTHVYACLTTGEQVINGHNGFESDQHLKNPVFKKVTGVVEVENNQ